MKRATARIKMTKDKSSFKITRSCHQLISFSWGRISKWLKSFWPRLVRRFSNFQTTSRISPVSIWRTSRNMSNFMWRSKPGETALKILSTGETWSNVLLRCSLHWPKTSEMKVKLIDFAPILRVSETSLKLKAHTPITKKGQVSWFKLSFAINYKIPLALTKMISMNCWR